MRKIIVLIVLFLAVAQGHAEEGVIADKTKEVCNQVMLNIYSEILQTKDQYKELADFGEDALFQNAHGIYSIIYQYGEYDPNERDPRKIPYAFGVTIDGIGENNFPQKDNVFNFSFPPLGVKFSGYQNRRLLRTQCDILPLLNKHGEILTQYQQKFLPLRLYIKPAKKAFHIREDIAFMVTLTNISKRNMLVDDLSEDSLFFVVDGEAWGTQPSQGHVDRPLTRAEQYAARREAAAARMAARRQRRTGVRPGPRPTTKGRRRILRAGESLDLILKGESFLEPRMVEVYAAYRMKVMDTNPTAAMTVEIIEE